MQYIKINVNKLLLLLDKRSVLRLGSVQIQIET